MSNQQLSQPPTGDNFDIDTIENSSAVAIGDGATAISGFTPEDVARFIAERDRIAKQEAEQAHSQTAASHSPIRISKKNPFGRAGKIQSPDHYLIRHPMTDEIFNELGKGASVSLVGASQTGKSSLLWHIAQTGAAVLNRPAEAFVYMDMEILHNDDDFFEYLCDELNIPVHRGFRLGRALRGRQIILCLDEFEKMRWQGFTRTVREELRGLADGNGARQPFTLLIASRTPLDRLFKDSAEETSPLANLCIRMNMPAFSLNEARALTTLYLKESGMMLPDEVVEHAWQQSSGHPQKLQVALKTAFAMRRATKSST